MHEYRVTLDDNGKRVDNVVMRHMAALRPELEISRTLIQGMIGRGEILLNGKIVKPGHKVRLDDAIKMDLEKIEKQGLAEHDRKLPKPEKVALDIIYEDDDIIAVNKPAGMVVHPACGNYSGTLVNALLNYKGFLTKFNEPRAIPRLRSGQASHEQRTMRPGIVHRLDKDTSGIMLIAKTGVAHRKLSRQLKNRTIEKKYMAVVKGVIELDEGIINAPVSHDKKDRRRMVIDEDDGKEAVTYYKVIARNKKENFSVLEVRPKTGRTHQIRIHLSHIKHPVLADRLYGGPKTQGLSRQALHAKAITFIHPTRNTKMELTAPLPPDLIKFA